jgi:hypothetical protein
VNVYLRRILFFFAIVCSLPNAKAQAQGTTPVSITAAYTSKPLQEVIADLESRYPLRFFYKNEWVANGKVTATLSNEPMDRALEKILSGTGLSFILYDHQTIVLLKDASPTAVPNSSIAAAPAPGAAPGQSTTPEPASAAATRQYPGKKYW